MRVTRATLPSPAEGRAALIAELLSPDGITREHAAFDMRTLRTEAYQRAPGLVAVPDVDRVLAELVRRDDVVEISRGVWTTREILDLEDGVLEWHGDIERRDAEPSAASRRRPAMPIASAPVDLSEEQTRRAALDPRQPLHRPDRRSRHRQGRRAPRRQHRLAQSNRGARSRWRSRVRGRRRSPQTWVMTSPRSPSMRSSGA